MKDIERELPPVGSDDASNWDTFSRHDIDESDSSDSEDDNIDVFGASVLPLSLYESDEEDVVFEGGQPEASQWSQVCKTYKIPDTLARFLRECLQGL